MNDWQLAQQVKHMLEEAVWPTGAGDPVFGSNGRVTVFAGTPTEDQLPKVYPAAMVGIGPATPDEDHPGLCQQEFTVIGAVSVTGDPMGENAVIGGPAINLGKSSGRGIAEINERIRNKIKDLTTMDGAKILMSQVSVDVPAVIHGRHLVIAEISVRAMCTTEMHYSAPQELKNVGNVWTWKGTDHIRDRFDFRQYRLGYVEGVVPAKIPEEATIVETVTTETATHTTVAGRAYTVFADYSARRQADGSPFYVEGSSQGDEVGAFLLT